MEVQQQFLFKLEIFFEIIGLTTIFNQFFSGNSTKNPERLIESLKEINFVRGSQKQFYIECFEENNKVKKLVFETKTVAIASYIYAKLTFLMFFLKIFLSIYLSFFLGNKEKKPSKKQVVKISLDILNKKLSLNSLIKKEPSNYNRFKKRYSFNMEDLNQEKSLDFQGFNLSDIPLKLNEGEQIKFLEKDVIFTIKNDDDETLQYNEGVIILSTHKVIWYSLKHEKGIFFNYQNAITHGYNKLKLVCLVNSQNYDEENAFIGVFGNAEAALIDEEEEEKKEDDIILTKIRSTEKIKNEDDFVQINGSYNVDFDFESKNRSSLQDVFQIFSECSALHPDLNAEENASNFMNMLGMMNPEEMLNGEEGENGENQNDENMDEEDNGEDDQNGGNDLVFE